MQRRRFRLPAVASLFAAGALLCVPFGAAWAARVGVLANSYQQQTATDFTTNIRGHTFTPVDTSASTFSLASLLANFDVLLVFEDSTFPSATAVGNAVAAYAQSGRAVVLGTFYDQDRSDASAEFAPHGWGALESIDPNTTDGVGTSYAARSLDPASIVPHPLTTGVTSLFANRFAGGNEPKPGTTVVAYWAQTNALGHRDPAIAYRITAGACVIHVAIAPQYPSIAAASTDFGGDFYKVWRNAFDFGAGHCVGGTGNLPGPAVIPTLSDGALALMALALALAAALSLPGVRARVRSRRPAR